MTKVSGIVERMITESDERHTRIEPLSPWSYRGRNDPSGNVVDDPTLGATPDMVDSPRTAVLLKAGGLFTDN